jgi:hypothetical protein
LKLQESPDQILLVFCVRRVHVYGMGYGVWGMGYEVYGIYADCD